MTTPQERDRQRFFQPVVETISLTLGLPVSVWLADETGQVLRIAAAKGLPEEYVDKVVLHLDGSNVASDVFAAGQAIVVSDIASDDRWKYKAEAGAMGLKSAMVAPLRVKKRIVGVLDVYAREIKDFSDSEKALVESCAAQVAITQRRIRDLEVLNQVSLLINSELKLSELFERITLSATQVLDCQHVSIFRMDESGDLLLEVSSTKGIMRKRFAPGEGLAGWVVRNKKPALVLNALSDSRFAPGLSSDITERSMLLVPIIIAGGEVVGVISADKDGLNGFDEHDQVLLETLARQAAVAVHNAQLFKQTAGRAAVLQKLHQIGEGLLSLELSAAGLENVLQQVARSAKSVLGADLVDIYRYVEAEDRYILPPVLEGERRDPFVPKERIFDDDVVVKVLKAGEPVYTPNTRTESLLSDPFTVERPQRPDKRFVVREEILSSAAVPLTAAGETVGVMFVNYRTQQTFAPDQQEIIELFANQAALAIYNARIYEQAQNRSEALKALSKMGQRLSTFEVTRKGLQQLLQEVAQQAKEVLDASLVELYQYSPGREDAVAAHASAGKKLVDIKPATKILPDDVAAKVLNRKTPLFTVDAQHESLLLEPFRIDRGKDMPDQRFVIREKIVSMAAIPLTVGDEVVGVLFVNYRSPQTFPPEQREMIQLFAGQAAAAIRNAQLFQQLEVLNEVGRTLTAGIRLRRDEVVELIYKQAKKLTGAQDMYIALYDDETEMIHFSLATEHGERVHYKARKADMEKRGKTEEVILTKEPILHRTLAESEAWYRKLGRREFIGRVQPSYLAVPMVLGEKVLGVIAIYDWEQEHAYDEQDLQVFSSMASQAAIALDNATLYYDVNKQLERRVGALEALNEVGRTLTAGIRLKRDDILELIYKQAKKLTGAQDMYIALYDDETEMIHFSLATEHGEQVHYEPRKADMEKRGKTEEVILTKEPILHRTLAESEAWYGKPGRKEFIGHVSPSWLGVPMVLGEKVLGVIAIYDWEKECAYDEQDLQVFSSMASQAAIALDNAALFQAIREEQKKNIVYGQLAAVHSVTTGFVHRMNNVAGTIPVRAGQIRELLDPSEPKYSKIVRYLDAINKDADGILSAAQEIRKSTRIAEPERVDIDTLVSTAIRRIAVPTGITISSRCGGLPPVLALSGRLVDTLEDLIRNGVEATEGSGSVTVVGRTLIADGRNWVSIEIKDTGHGIPSKDLHKIFDLFFSTKPGGMGLGLWGAKVLVESLGGRIDVSSEVGKGTTFTILLPV